MTALILRAGSAVTAFLAGFLAVPLSVVGAVTADGSEALRGRTLLDAGWLFHRGDAPATSMIAPNLDERGWRAVEVPHDYVLDGNYTLPDQAVDRIGARLFRNHAYLPVEPAWYRRHLIIPEGAQEKELRLEFDGVCGTTEVWLNGQPLGRHRNSYTPFSFDISAAVRFGADNVIAVRTDPREHEGWWYEGGGIYRHVYLTALAPWHVAAHGLYVATAVSGLDHGAAARAELTLHIALEYPAGDRGRGSVVSDVIAPDGTVKGNARSDVAATDGQLVELVQRVSLNHPQLWSLASPQLYRLRTTVFREGKAVDRTVTTFGIRTIRFDPDRGFFLNGEHVLIQGAAVHQDFGGIGIAVPDSLQAWRVEQLKKMGANGWRTAHNPPSEALLDACDRLGMLVMDENRHFGATYDRNAPPGTQAGDLEDLAAMIRRDRNHPCIIMWSMCNEEKLQGTAEGRAVFSAMIRKVRELDPTRPVTSAMNHGWLAEASFADVEDIVGINYHPDQYDAIHARHPDKMLFCSEGLNQKTARGEYVQDAASGMASAYNLSDKSWLAIASRPFMAGAYVWTGFDYKGEPNPFGWPDVGNNTGLMDNCGFPKDKYYYFKSCWTDAPMVRLVPSSWNGPVKAGEPVRVIAFTNAPKVELFLNGRSLGARDVARGEFAEWSVPFEVGRLAAKAYANGAPVADDEIETTGKAVRIALSVDRRTLRAGAEDAVVVAVSLRDEKGRVVPDAQNRVTFGLSGGGRILGVANGNPADHDPDHGVERNAFHGRCMTVIGAGAQPGRLTLTASGRGLSPGTVTFDVQP